MDVCVCVYVCMWGVLLDMTFMAPRFFPPFCLHVYVCVSGSACLCSPASLCFFLREQSVSVNNGAHASSIPSGCSDLPGPVGFYTAIPRRHLHPKKINN